MKIITADGEEMEMPARECDRCDGTGVLARPVTLQWRSMEGDETYTVHAKPGDKCPACRGRGMVGILGEFEMPLKASEIN